MGAADIEVAGTTGPAVPAPTADNPYSRLAIDTMRGIRVHSLTLSPSIVAYLKMLVMLGTIRHELAIDYDLRANVQRLLHALMRQRGDRSLDPRLAMERFYDVGVRVSRSMSSSNSSRRRNRSSSRHSRRCSASVAGCKPFAVGWSSSVSPCW